MKFLSRVSVSVLILVAVCCLLLQTVVSDSRRGSEIIIDKVLMLSKVTSDFAARHPSDVEVVEKLRSITAVTSNVRAQQIYKYIISYARNMMAEGRQVDVFDLLSSLASLVELDKGDVDKTAFILDMYVLLGAAADETGMSNICMEYYTRGLSLAEEIGEEKYLPRFYNNIGVSYFRLGDVDKAESYFKRALDLNKRLGLNYDLFLNYNNLSEVDLQRNQLDEALDDALNAMQYLHGAADKDKPAVNMEGYIQSVIATIYINKKEYHIARSYVENAITQQRRDAMNSDLFESYLINSELFLHEQKPDSALKWVNNALALLSDQSFNMRSNALERLSRIENSRGNIAASLAHLREAYSLRDSLANIEKIKRMEQCQQIYEVERKNSRDMQSVSNLKGLSLTLLILLCFVLLLMIRQYLEKRKAYKGMQEMQANMEQMYQEHEEQNESLKRESNELRAQLDLSHRQLTNYTIQKLRSGQQTEELVADMRRLINDNDSRTKDLKDNLSKLLSKINVHKSGDDWTEFNYYFERVNTAFYRNLKAEHPDITEKQKRLCALLYLGLNTKEIAQITFREVRSIESSRTRLRKKLGLGEEDNLNEYFQKFAEDNED